MTTHRRQGLSKKLRFSIFARDSFSCRYCGAQADTVKLVVDHVIPIKEGGSNDEANLLTACEPCNQGKGARLLEQAAPTEEDRLRMAQEAHEQAEAARVAKEVIDSRRRMLDLVVDVWCDARQQTEVDSSTIRVIASYARQHGIGQVAEWIEWAHCRMPEKSDRQLGKYISGIRRRMMNEGGL